MQDTILELDPSLSRFPVRMSTLEKGFKETTEPEYETDENGNQIEIPKATYSPLGVGGEMVLYAATDKDIEKMRELITSVTMISNNGTAIPNIINEEVPAFYEGDKSAEEVAAIIQNRVETYLNEIK